MTMGIRGRLGRRGEDLAAEALARRGFRVLDRNWRCTAGEVDLVVSSGNDVYFVEVRTRRGSLDFIPELSITHRKAERMDQVARAYMGSHASSGEETWHVSFVAIAIGPNGKLERISFYPALDAEPLDLLPPDQNLGRRRTS